MTTIRKFVYAAVLAATAMNFAPSLAAAQEPAHGKFTLKHNVNWSNAVVPAGDYEFSYDPYQSRPLLTLSKLSGAGHRLRRKQAFGFESAAAGDCG